MRCGGRLLVDQFEQDYVVERGLSLSFFDLNGQELLSPHENNNRRHGTFVAFHCFFQNFADLSDALPCGEMT